jgi:hypothetical protein
MTKPGHTFVFGCFPFSSSSSLSRSLFMTSGTPPRGAGWAQVEYGYGASIEDGCCKLEYVCSL